MFFLSILAALTATVLASDVSVDNGDLYVDCGTAPFSGTAELIKVNFYADMNCNVYQGTTNWCGGDLEEEVDQFPFHYNGGDLTKAAILTQCSGTSRSTCTCIFYGEDQHQPVNSFTVYNGEASICVPIGEATSYSCVNSNGS